MEPEKFPSDPYTDPSLPPEPVDSAEDFGPYDSDAIAAELGLKPAAFDAEEPGPEPNGMLTEVSKPEGLSNVFAHRETGTLIKIVKDDGAYITYAALDGAGRYSMPRSEYDANFAKSFRPAEAKDLAKLQGDLVVPRPAGAPPDWR